MTESITMIAALFLKAPVPGTVKTRLAKRIGNDAACQAYRALVAHQLARIPSAWRTVIFYSPDDAEHEFRLWLGDDTQLIAQCAGDLGARQAAAVETLSQTDPVCLIGADCPYLDPTALSGLARSLMANDIALIPATDGGYVAMAVRAGMASATISLLFSDIDWGTETVCRDVLKNAEKLGLRVALRSALEDVDTVEAWQRAEQMVMKI